MADREHIKQCKTCPWRVGCVPDKDIPRYDREKHLRLKSTIRTGAESIGQNSAMACHYSACGNEIPCAGWLHNQLGDGNNIGVRIAVMSGCMPIPDVDGPQHSTFQKTIRRKTRKKP